ncbi:MAG: hypothetical protein GY937_26395 [bacterium]|nr:hypothetical protein [bacterium]
MNAVDSDRLAEKYRAAALRAYDRRLLIADLTGTAQESDLSEPANCEGLGRVRHFRRSSTAGWVPNPLPIAPASKALGLSSVAELRAEVFQLAACNWRCWYCYVPFSLLGANPRHASWRSADELVGYYGALADPPPMIDLSGGQPDLTPEWVLWTMDALEERGLEHRVYLWSDDNLSNDYFWRFLSDRDRERIASYQMYGRVCCFKGIDAPAFAFNTQADEALFGRQFDLFARLLDLGVDLFAYVTLTVSSLDKLETRVERFVDRLQAIDENLGMSQNRLIF